jgi:hypothetical protein
MDSGKAHPTNSEQECPRASAFFRAFEKVPSPGPKGGRERGVAKKIENCPSQVEEFANFAKFCEALAKYSLP